MRLDYGFYVVAIICFVIAALPYYYSNVVHEELLQPGSFTSTALTVVFSALGLISVILGYSLRPKPIISVPKAPEPTLPPSPPSALPYTEEPMVAPPSETAKTEEKKTDTETRRKKSGRRRKKV